MTTQMSMVEANIARSKEIIRECEQFGYKYFDIADGGIELAHEKAYESLLQKCIIYEL